MPYLSKEKSMKKLIIVLALTLASWSGSAFSHGGGYGYGGGRGGGWIAPVLVGALLYNSYYRPPFVANYGYGISPVMPYYGMPPVIPYYGMPPVMPYYPPQYQQYQHPCYYGHC